jgi:L-asparaginase II
MRSTQYLPVFELTRGEIVESIHYGSIAVVSPDGQLMAHYGDPHAVTFLRSSAKPFQALPFLEAGGQEYYNLSLREIAVMCASHSGTDEHVAVIEGIHQKAGLSEDDLLCGIHPPSHKATREALQARGESPTPIRHNCSGKHTGMLAFAAMQGLSTQDYINPAHPIQQRILQTFAGLCNLEVEQVSLGTDGCSAPNFAVPLYNAALAYARLCDPERGKARPPDLASACQVVTSAMMAHPFMIAGPQRFDTMIMEAAGQRLVCKGGAEGYQALGLMPNSLSPGSPALGIAIKISDGDLHGHSRPPDDPGGHARPAVVLEILRQLGADFPDVVDELSEFGPTFTLHNWRGLEVGEGRPCFNLLR